MDVIGSEEVVLIWFKIFLNIFGFIIFWVLWLAIYIIHKEKLIQNNKIFFIYSTGFNWDIYLEESESKAAPNSCFKQVKLYNPNRCHMNWSSWVVMHTVLLFSSFSLLSTYGDIKTSQGPKQGTHISAQNWRVASYRTL